MNRIIRTLLILLSVSLLLPLQSEMTMTSSVISNGGINNSTSGNITLSSTVAESVIGVSASGNTDLLSGFWYTYLSAGSSDIGDNELLPFKYELAQNYPNPFNPSTTINYELQAANNVTLAIYNVKGELIQNVINNKMMQEGKHSITFDGSRLSSGYYFYRISVGINGQDFTKIKKMIMVK